MSPSSDPHVARAATSKGGKFPELSDGEGSASFSETSHSSDSHVHSTGDGSSGFPSRSAESSKPARFKLSFGDPSDIDYSWVSSSLLDEESTVTRRDLDLALQCVGNDGEEWQIEDMGIGEHIATFPTELKFTMYMRVLHTMKIRPPFTKFERGILRFLDVAPSQLNPNSWGFVKAFEVLLGELQRPVSRKLFFTIFDTNRRGEKDSHQTRWESLSLKAATGFRLFQPYMDNVKKWRSKFLWVAPTSRGDQNLVGYLDDRGEVTDFVFPIAWSPRHYLQESHTYRYTARQLSITDKETLRLLRNLASHLPSKEKLIPCKPFVLSDSPDELAIALEEMAGGKLSFADLVANARRGAPKRGVSVHAEGSTPVSSPPGREAHPQTPPVDPQLVGGLQSSQRTKKRRVDDPVSDGTAHQSTGVDDHGKKKHGRGKSPRVMLNQLGAAYNDRFAENPIDTAIDVLQAASKQLKKAYAEEDERLAELTTERDKALEKAKKAQDALEEAEKKASMLKEELRKSKSAQEVSESKMKEELQSKEASKAKMKEEFEKLVSTLQDEVEVLKKERDDTEKALEEAKEWGDKVTDEAVDIAAGQFDNALEQVHLRYPEVVVDRAIFDPNHSVLGDQIVKPAGRPDGTNLVIYQRP